MKKCIAVIIVLTIVLSAVLLPVSSADGMAFSENMDNVVGLLTTLEIIEEASDLESPVTRGEFMQLLVNAAGWKDFLATDAAPLFSDVNKGHPYFGAINIAKQRNLISTPVFWGD